MKLTRVKRQYCLPDAVLIWGFKPSLPPSCDCVVAQVRHVGYVDSYIMYVVRTFDAFMNAVCEYQTRNCADIFIGIILLPCFLLGEVLLVVSAFLIREFI